MPDPDPRHANDPQHPAEAAPPTGRPDGPQGTAAPQVTNPEAAFGGADAVPKTTYGVGHGTGPRRAVEAEPAAHPPSGAGPNYLAWGVGTIALVVALFYLIGAMR